MQSELATVATFRNAFEAHAAKNMLEEQGIRAFLADENFSNLSYAVPVTAKVSVAQADAERAKELLSEKI